MKKKLLAYVAVGVLLASCSASSEDYTVAAKELCSCMKENGNEGADDPMIKVNLGLCLLDAGVDLKDPQMSKAVETECSEIKEGFEDYVKSM